MLKSATKNLLILHKGRSEMNKSVNIFLNSVSSIFSHKKMYKLSSKSTLFMDSSTTLQQKYWSLTASHLINQMKRYDKEQQSKK